MFVDMLPYESRSVNMFFMTTTSPGPDLRCCVLEAPLDEQQAGRARPPAQGARRSGAAAARVDDRHEPDRHDLRLRPSRCAGQVAADRQPPPHPTRQRRRARAPTARQVGLVRLVERAARLDPHRLWARAPTTTTSASRLCCSCASTTPGVPRWQLGSCARSPATGSRCTRRARHRAISSTRWRWRQWPNATSTSPPQSRSAGPTTWRAPPT